MFIDHTTVSARIARQIAVEARDLQVHCVDAPVTGGQAGAEKGQLTVMCGGRADAIAAATPIMEAYTKRIVHVGKAGAGQTTKMVNQIAFAGILATLSEAPAVCRGGASRSRQGLRGDFGRSLAIVADGQPLAHHGQGRVRLRLRD